MKIPYGDRAAREVSERIAAAVATLTELKAIPADRRVAGMIVFCTADASYWRFHGTSALTGDDLLVASPSAGSGKWLRCPGAALLRCAITFATADAAVLLTVPTGGLLQILEPFWEPTANWTGGSSSAIGLSSNKTGFTSKGDLLGGATGDVAATLLAASSPTVGTIGAGFDSLAKRRVLWKPAENVLFDRITSVFTAGTGFASLAVNVLKNNGA